MNYERIEILCVLSSYEQAYKTATQLEKIGFGKYVGDNYVIKTNDTLIKILAVKQLLCHKGMRYNVILTLPQHVDAVKKWGYVMLKHEQGGTIEILDD